MDEIPLLLHSALGSQWEDRQWGLGGEMDKWDSLSSRREAWRGSKLWYWTGKRQWGWCRTKIGSWQGWGGVERGGNRGERVRDSAHIYHECSKSINSKWSFGNMRKSRKRVREVKGRKEWIGGMEEAQTKLWLRQIGLYLVALRVDCVFGSAVPWTITITHTDLWWPYVALLPCTQMSWYGRYWVRNADYSHRAWKKQRKRLEPPPWPPLSLFHITS